MTRARRHTAPALATLLLLTGAPLALAVPDAAAAEPTCQGQPATIIGTPYQDELYGTSGDDVVWLGGTELDDAYDATDTFDGGAGDDLVCQGGLGQAIVHGGAGNDEIYLDGEVTERADHPDFWALLDWDLQAVGGTGADLLVATPVGGASLDGGDGDDVLRGGARGDLLDGGKGTDQIFGGDGDDVILEGPGSDVIDGEGGRDNVRYSQSLSNYELLIHDYVPDPVVVDVSSGSVQSGADLDTTAGVECWTGTSKADTMIGSNAADCLDGALGTGEDTIAAGDGDDTVTLDSGSVRAGAGDDTVHIVYPYTEPDDTDHDPVFTTVQVNGGPGDDVVRGHARRVEATGGPGRDTLDLPGFRFRSDRAAMLRIDVPDGLVTLLRDLEFKSRTEFEGFENYLGSDEDDVFRGSGKDEYFRGRGGDDRALGARGRDTLIGSKGRDRADGGPGRDRCSAERRVNCEAGA